MWTLYRQIPEGKSYLALIGEAPNVEFDYYVSLDDTLTVDDKLTSISEWFKFYNQDIEQYSICRQECKGIANATTWSELSDADKDSLIELDLANPTDATQYLIGKGYTLLQAKGKLLQAFAYDHKRNVEACQFKMRDPHLYIIIGKHLPLSEATDFFTLTRNLSGDYERQAIKGSLDSSSGQVGFFDFIESTVGTVYDNAGLHEQGFTYNAGSDSSALKTELMGWFRYHKKY